MTLEEKVVQILNEKGLVMATAESCTGGYIAKRITDVSGSSAVFNCGIVSYSNEIKEKVLGVKSETLSTYGAVSEQTVAEMVKGVLRISGADLAVSVSGIAGPDSDSTNKPVGMICFAASNEKETKIQTCYTDFTENVRNNNREFAVNTALEMVLDLVGELK